MTRIVQVLLTHEEITALAVALAKSIDPDCEPADATAASAIVWRSGTATQVQCSLSTMLAEATYQ